MIRTVGNSTYANFIVFRKNGAEFPEEFNEFIEEYGLDEE